MKITARTATLFGAVCLMVLLGLAALTYAGPKGFPPSTAMREPAIPIITPQLNTSQLTYPLYTTLDDHQGHTYLLLPDNAFHRCHWTFTTTSKAGQFAPVLEMDTDDSLKSKGKG